MRITRIVDGSLRGVAEPSRDKRVDRVTWEDAARAEMKDRMQRLKRLDGPIVVGPWLSEVGFEVLYWVPFLRWAVDRFELDPARLVAVSRGGVSSWYAGIALRYLDVFDAFTPDDFRSLTYERWQAAGGQKQLTLSEFDRRILDAFGDDLPWNDSRVLHPSIMYRLFRNTWRETVPWRHVLRHTHYERWVMPPAGVVEALEPGYVAAKFYARPSFEDTSATRRLVSDLVSRIVTRRPVALLHTGLELDDHAELHLAARDGVVMIADGADPGTNLTVQSAVIARASAFVGTYGGLSYVASAYGVPSVGLYTDARHLLPGHLELARRAAAAYGTTFNALDVRHLDAWGPGAFAP